MGESSPPALSTVAVCSASVNARREQCAACAGGTAAAGAGGGLWASMVLDGMRHAQCTCLQGVAPHHQLFAISKHARAQITQITFDRARPAQGMVVDAYPSRGSVTRIITTMQQVNGQFNARTGRPLRVGRAHTRTPLAAQAARVPGSAQQQPQQQQQQHQSSQKQLHHQDQPATGHAAPGFAALLPRQAVAMFAAGAALGPLCDGLHSQHGVLKYAHPSIHLDGPLGWSFETCW
jgi:hypothetical protein